MNFYTFNRGLSKRLHRYFIYQATKKKLRNDIKKKIKMLKCEPLTKIEEQEAKEFYSSYGFSNIDTNWHRYFKHLNGKFHKEYIPEDFFYNVIEPSLNMRLMFPALTDKNILDKFFPNIIQPKNILNNINGIYIKSGNNNILTFDEAVEECNKYDELVIKPTIESGGGKNVSIITLKDGKTDYQELKIGKVLETYDKNFIVQERLEQHEQMSLLNESSINTLRIKTLLINERIIVLKVVVRIGMKGSKVDNMSKGGYILLVKDNGKLYHKGFLGTGMEIKKTNLSFDIENFEVPNFENILTIVRELHKQILHFKMISWDIAIDKKGNPILIEFNVFGQGVGQEYGPLFGKYTDEILKSCKVKLFSF